MEVDAFNDLAELADSGEIATSAAIAAWKGAVVALEDEADLEPWCLDTMEEEMDSYDPPNPKNRQNFQA